MSYINDTEKTQKSILPGSRLVLIDLAERFMELVLTGVFFARLNTKMHT